MAVGYGKLRPAFLDPSPASGAHRAIGDAAVAVTLVVAVMCIGYFGWDDGGLHAVLGAILLAVLALKIAVVRSWIRGSRALPLLGATVLSLFAATWAASAGDFLFG